MNVYHKENFDIGKLSPNNIDRIQIEMIPDNSRVLEIGCATGFMSEYLGREKNCEVVCLETDAEAAEIAREKCHLLYRGSIDQKSAQDEIDNHVKRSGKFDVVFMSQVIEHIAGPEPVLVKIRDWIEPDGILVISTCNVAHWQCRLRLLAGKWDYEESGIFDKTHLRFFTVHSFRKILEKCGYAIIEEGHSILDICPFLLLFDKRLIPPSDILRIIPVWGNNLRRQYIHLMRNLISNQFVYKARIKTPDTHTGMK